jgi:hypothetical protein
MSRWVTAGWGRVSSFSYYAEVVELKVLRVAALLFNKGLRMLSYSAVVSSHGTDTLTLFLSHSHIRSPIHPSISPSVPPSLPPWHRHWLRVNVDDVKRLLT